MIPQPRKYFALIVHFGDTTPTKLAIADLLNQKVVPNQIVVIDQQGNLDGQMNANAVVHVLTPGENHGYAGGLNIGLGYLFSQGARLTDVVLCMNNDVRLQPGVTSYLIDYFTDNDHERTILSASIGRINLFTGKASLGMNKNSAHWWQVAYPHGSFFAAPFALFAAIKGLPDDYFLYWEDVVIGQRATRMGYALALLPVQLVRHDEKKDQTPTGGKLYYLARNGAFFLQSMPQPWGTYWRARNSIRRQYHRFFGNRAMIKALQDAKEGHLKKQQL